MYTHIVQFTSKHKLSVRRMKNIHENQMLNGKHGNNKKLFKYIWKKIFFNYLEIINT